MVIGNLLIILGMKYLILRSYSKATKRIPSHCEDLMCANESPCRTTVSQEQGEGGGIAECFCQGKWTGPRCELEILLGATDIKDDSVALEIRTRSSRNKTLYSNPHHKYTLKYWSNGTDHECVLVQEVTSSIHVIGGLTSALHYTFCSETGIVDFCEVTRFDRMLPSNCVVVQTLSSSAVPATSNFINIGVSLIVVFIILILIVVIGIIVLRNHQQLHLEVLLSLCICHACGRRKIKTEQSVSPICEPSGRSELSPCKLNPRLAKRAKSYGAKCEGQQTLTTLIEDSDDIVIVRETSLSEPLAQRVPL